MPRRFKPSAVVLAALTSFSVSCAVTDDMISPEWTPEMFFKNAQDAMDEKRYKDALFYYEVFMVRYPENRQKKIAAQYERALIHYKTGDLRTAEAEFRAIIKQYDESPYAMLYHPRFRDLCEIGLKNIEKHRSVKNKLFWRAREKQWSEENGESLLDLPDTPL